jgi:methionine synthase I (cobalamin-dependent)
MESPEVVALAHHQFIAAGAKVCLTKLKVFSI